MIDGSSPTITKLDGVQAGNLWRKIYSYECGYYTTWINQCKSNREFYYGEQSTAEEKQVMAERGQYEIVMNKIRKAMRGIVGMVAAAVPQYKLLPMADNDYYTASIGEKIIKWAWSNSKGINIMRLFVKNAAVDNISYFHVFVDNMSLIKFSTLAFNEVIPDPSCTDPLFRDAEMLMIRRDVSRQYVREYYGLTEDLIDKIEFESSYPSNPGGVDTYTASSEIPMADFLQKIFSADRQYVRIYEIYRKVYQRNEATNEVSVRIAKETVLGYNHVFTEMLDPRITEYPIIPGYVDKAENPYARGEVHFVKDLQRFINKSYGVALLNAQLMSNPKVFITETDIPNNNIASMQQDYSIPGKIVVLAAGSQPPLIVQGQPLNQAFFTLYQDAKMEMEWNTLPNQVLGMMDSEKAGYGSSALLDMKQTVLDSYKDFMSNIELACTQLGIVVLQYARAYLPENKIIRILGEEDVVVNKPEMVDVDDEQQVQEYIRYMGQKGVPEERIQEELASMKMSSEKKKAITYFKNDLDFDKYDVTVVPGSYTPTFEMSMLRLMMELLQTGAVDPSVVLKYLPVDNRKELVERYDTIKILQSQIENIENENKELNNLVDSMSKQLISANIKTASEEGKLKIDGEVKMQRIKSYLEKHREKLSTAEARNKMYADIKDIISDVELEAEKQKLKMRAGQEPLEDFENILASAFAQE